MESKREITVATHSNLHIVCCESFLERCHMPFSHPKATTDLEGGAALVLAGFRQVVFGQRDEPPFLFHQCVGRDASQLVEALQYFATALAAHSRKRLRLHHACCCHLSPDEIMILRLLDAAQESSSYELQARLDWAAHAEGHEILRDGLNRINDILTCHALDVSVPKPHMPIPDWARPFQLYTNENPANKIRSG